MDTITIAARDGGTVTLRPEQIDQLASSVGAPMLRSGDDGWDQVVLLWNGMAAKTPSLVLQPTSAQEVAAAVRFARDHGLLLSVKGGGHNIAGTAIAEQGLTLDMSRMRDVVVDPEMKLANVGPGCLLGDVDRATQEHGLATVLGFISQVGVAGLVLGGGLGYLTRRFGWSADNLEEVEIVTADGDIRTANREINPDLFWAVRGGGGNYGIVTRFTLRLHEVGPMVHGGLIAWPFARAGEILRAYRDLTENAPRELSVWCVMMHAPPAPFVPEAARGKKIIAMSVCYSGDLAETETVIAPIRAIGQPVVDLLHDWPYVEQQSFLDETEPKGAHYYWKTEFAETLADELLEEARARFAACDIAEAQVGFLHLGGALNERAPGDGAVGNRDARYAFGVNGMWEPEDPNGDANRAWVRKSWSALRGYGTGGNYINFQTDDEDEQRVRATYGSNYARLIEIKKAYDPSNLFRVNRNIAPGG